MKPSAHLISDSCLDINVSCVKNYYSKYPKEVNLLTWLNSGKYAHTIQQLRNTTDAAERKRLKGSLPAITPSGLFTRVDEQHLVSHSGLVQFDIDYKDNQHICNYRRLHLQLRNIPNIAYCGLSAGGNGWWGLVRIGYTDRHEQHWEYIRRVMQRLGITLDEAPKNVCALRGYSHDPHAYYNHHAVKLYHYIAPAAQRRFMAHTQHTVYTSRAEQHIQMLERTRQDITDSYRAWFTIGCNFAATFGEEGRDYYHRVSCYHPKYQPADCDYQYNKCLLFVKQQQSEAGLGYFIKRCNEAQGRAA